MIATTLNDRYGVNEEVGLEENGASFRSLDPEA